MDLRVEGWTYGFRDNPREKGSIGPSCRMFLGDISQETSNPGNGCFLGGAGSRALAMGRPRLPGAICSWEPISPSREGLRGKCSWEILATRRRALLGGFSRERILPCRRCLGDPHSWEDVFFALPLSFPRIRLMDFSNRPC